MIARPPIPVVIVAVLALATALLFAQQAGNPQPADAETQAAQPDPPTEADPHADADDADDADADDADDADADDETDTDDEAGLDAETVLEQLGEDFAPTVESLANGEINWTTGHVVATGVSQAEGASAQDVAMAKRAARLIAARNAILTIAQIRLGGGMRLGEIADGQISVDAALEDFEEVSAEFDERTRTATVRLRAPLCGANGVVNLAGVRLPRRDEWLWPYEPAGSSSNPVDGVVIDARNVEVSPAAFPAFVTESGQSIFDIAQLRADRRTQCRLALYLRSDAPSRGFGAVRQARDVARRVGAGDAALTAAAGKVFDRPLVLSAVGTADGEPSTLVLSPAAVRDLAINSEARRCFQQGLVIIVIDTQGD